MSRSEDSYGEKIDKCLYNSLSKFVVGVGVGIFASVVVRYKPWPIILGGGVGLGMGISDCNYEFKSASLSKAIKQSLEGKRTSPAFVSQKKKAENNSVEEETEYEKKRFVGIVGRSPSPRGRTPSPTNYQDQ